MEQPSPPPCRRCKQNPGPLKLRDDPTCNDCFVKYIGSKVAKRLEVMYRDLSGHNRQMSPSPPLKYLVGLSFGPASTALVHVLRKALTSRLGRNSRSLFDLLVVHVDTRVRARFAADSSESPGPRLLQKFRERFPEIQFECVSLDARSDVWRPLAALGGQDVNADGGVSDLQTFYDSLPSATSKADMMRILLRRVLVCRARETACSALILGHTSTALSELALSEVAKGRGFSAPWLVGDGPLPRDGGHGTRPSGDASKDSGDNVMEISVYRPLREVFRGEVATYAGLVDPPLDQLVAEDESRGNGGSAVISHRDLSVEEVMARYFDDTEASYPSIVANVVKTMGKLERPGENGSGGSATCAVCSLALDDQGDARWEGEIGDTGQTRRGREGMPRSICYGCSRTIYG